MSYISEFPDYDGEFHIIEGWYDNSWHNDVCPHLEKRYRDGSTEIAVMIWQDYVDPEQREIYGGKRYLLQIKVNENCVFSYDTNKWKKIEKLAKGFDFYGWQKEL